MSNGQMDNGRTSGQSPDLSDANLSIHSSGHRPDMSNGQMDGQVDSLQTYLMRTCLSTRPDTVRTCPMDNWTMDGLGAGMNDVWTESR